MASKRSEDLTASLSTARALPVARAGAGRLPALFAPDPRDAGITKYLPNGGKLEIAQQIANHESARTTGLYDRRSDQVSLDEVERIRI